MFTLQICKYILIHKNDTVLKGENDWVFLKKGVFLTCFKHATLFSTLTTSSAKASDFSALLRFWSIRTLSFSKDLIMLASGQLGAEKDVLS